MLTGLMKLNEGSNKIIISFARKKKNQKGNIQTNNFF